MLVVVEKEVASHLERVKDEHFELNRKIMKLEVFMGTEVFKNLGDQDRFDLYDQIHYMKGYRTQLRLRLGWLERK